MARPIWSGTISFGLLQVPVKLMTAERRSDLHFRLLDSRDKARVRYERINADTGEEVPWKDVVKAFEYEKGNYVVLEDEDFERAAPEGTESVEIEAFIDPGQIDPRYYDKPYYLVPGARAEKAYVLLRETLRDEGLAGLARVVIRTREHLAMLIAEEQALVLILLRFPQELVAQDNYDFPEAGRGRQKISAKELDMAGKLVASMREDFDPANYHDEYREKLTQAIEQRLKKKDVVEHEDEEEERAPEGAATNVVDFMALLKKSIEENKRQPAKGKSASGKSGTKKSGGKKSSKSKSGKGKSGKSGSPSRSGGKKAASNRKSGGKKSSSTRKKKAG